jgi:CDP-diacylglycerol---serine O-phosphatidyltransferase
MSKIKDNIPNGVTLLNLFSGSIAVVLALSGHLNHASWFIFLAALFDFIDGFTARLLHARSEIGAQLDSLADVVSFGLAPAIIMYVLLDESPDLLQTSAGEFRLLPFIALFLALASAYRLARFNIDPGQNDRFYGLPTPAMGIFIAAVPLAQNQYDGNELVAGFLSSQYTLLAAVIIFSWLMVSQIPMIAIKFKNLSWKENTYQFILLGLSAVLLVLFRFAGFAMSILMYITISVLQNFLHIKKN